MADQKQPHKQQAAKVVDVYITDSRAAELLVKAGYRKVGDHYELPTPGLIGIRFVRPT